MKTILLTPFFIFLFSFSAYSQTSLEYIISEHPYAQVNKVIHVDGKTFLGGAIYSCDFATVFAFDENGEKEWEFSTDGYSWVNDMVFRESDSVLIIANFWAQGDDYTTMYDGPNIIGLDLNGNIVFEKHLSFDCCGASRDPSPSIALTDSDEVVVINGKNVFWLDDMGELFHSEEYIDYEFTNVEAFADSILFFTHEDKLIIMDATGSINNTLSVGTTILDLEIDGENLLILTVDRIFHYQISNQIINATNSFSLNAKGISFDDNWVYVWGEDLITSEYRIQQHDKTSYNFLQSIALNQSTSIMKDLVSDGTQLYIAATKNMDTDNSLYPLYQPFIKTTPIFTDATYSNLDISLSNFQLIEPAIVSYYDSMEYIYYYENDHFVFEYDLTNLGTDTISSFTLISQRYGGINCSQARHFNHLENLMLAPNSTITFRDSIGSFFTQYMDALHLTAFAPNHKFDGDESNNLLLGLNLILDVDCACAGLNFDLKISPNPTSDILNINFSSEDFSTQEKFRIVSIDGRILGEVNLIFGKNNYTIGLENYANGIYIFQYLKNNQVASAEKIIVQK